MSRFVWCLAALMSFAGCNCNNVPWDPDGGSVGGGTGTGGNNTGVGGGSGGGDGGGSATAGGSGGSGGGVGTGGGSAGGGSAGGGSAGGGSAGGGSAGGGSAGGGSAGGGSAGGGSAGGGSAGGGSAGGGSAGGGSAGGGSAGGGSAGGGSAGGGMGGAGGGAVNPCGGAPAGTYVCPTCPMASDMNNGSASCPLSTITRGIQNATALSAPRVFIASRYMGGANIVYAEDLTVPVGVTLEGRYLVTSGAGGLNWSSRGTAPSDRSVIQNTNTNGIRFAAGAQRMNTGIDGLAVRTAAGFANLDKAGITVIDSSPTLRDFAVTGTPVTMALPANETAIAVASIAARSDPLITIGTISSIRAQQGAFGIAIAQARASITQVQISELFSTGGGSTSTAVGIALSSAASTQISQSTVSATQAVLCAGIFATGNVSDIVIDNVGASGCAGTAGFASLPSVNAGAIFDQCTALTGMPAVYRNSARIIGGPVQSQGVAVGIDVSDGCSVDIQNNALIQGANGSSSGTNTFAAGVVCTYQRLGASPGVGSDAPCRVIANGTITGAGTPGITVAVGIACIGSCATKTALCAGSCTEIRDNKANANGGGGISPGIGSASQTGIYIEQSSPAVTRNSVTFNQSASCSIGRGVILQGSASTLVNNGIIGPTCSGASSIGVEVIAAARADMLTPAPTLTSNSILSHAWFGSTPAVPAFQAGVRLSPPSGPVIGLGSIKLGTYTSNIIQAGPGGARAFAFEEGSTSVDPSVLNRNDFLISGAGPDGGVLYLDENASMYTNAAQINAMVDVTATANVSLNPAFTSVQFSFPHITPGTSPVRGIGPAPATGIPTDDWDGQQRPQGSGGGIDIGADEVQ